MEFIKTVNSIKIINNFLSLHKKWKNGNYYNIKNKIFSIQLKKIFLVEKNKHFNTNKILYVIIDIRFLKTKIIFFNKKKCLITMSNGLIFKKMNLKNKKSKKSEKTTNLLLKNLVTKSNLFRKFEKVIIYIKGVKKNLQNMIKFVNLNVKKNNFFIFIHNSKISNNNFFGFKKIKAIKKKIKKKIIKLK